MGVQKGQAGEEVRTVLLYQDMCEMNALTRDLSYNNCSRSRAKPVEDRWGGKSSSKRFDNALLLEIVVSANKRGGRRISQAL